MDKRLVEGEEEEVEAVVDQEVVYLVCARAVVRCRCVGVEGGAVEGGVLWRSGRCLWGLTVATL